MEQAEFAFTNEPILRQNLSSKFLGYEKKRRYLIECADALKA